MSVPTLEIQPSTSLFNPQSMSDASLIEELKKYSRANLPTMTFELIATEFGKAKNWVWDMSYRVSKGHSFNEDTRDRIISYLIRKGWFSPAGLPRHRETIIETENTVEIPQTVIVPEASAKLRYKFERFSDHQVRQELKNFYRSNRNIYKEPKDLAGQLEMSHHMLIYYFNRSWRSTMSQEVRTRMIDFLVSKNWEPASEGSLATEPIDYSKFSPQEMRTMLREFRDKHGIKNSELAKIIGCGEATASLLCSPKNTKGMEKWIRAGIIKVLQSKDKPAMAPETKAILGTKVQETVEQITAQREEKKLPAIGYAFAGVMQLNITEDKKEDILRFLQDKLL